MCIGTKVVVNTYPWITLCTCGQVNILKSLFSHVLMPEAVRDEISAGGMRVGARELKESQWVKVERVHDREKTKFLYELGRGEAEVLIPAGILKEAGE